MYLASSSNDRLMLNWFELLCFENLTLMPVRNISGKSLLSASKAFENRWPSSSRKLYKVLAVNGGENTV